jgi:hypothetical protein
VRAFALGHTETKQFRTDLHVHRLAMTNRVNARATKRVLVASIRKSSSSSILYRLTGEDSLIKVA